MKQIMLFPVLCFGCIMCGIYGALHNQISYTVSPSFFHLDLFERFETPETLQNRLGASIVGWQSSWWMGLFVCPPILLVGQVLPGSKAYLTRCLLAFGVVAATTLLVGLGALAYATSNPGVLGSVDCAGVMHNFSYLGGFIGIITGSAFLVWERAKIGGVARKRFEEGLANTFDAQIG